MNRQETRYSRQTSLEGFGETGQAKLAAARVAIIGLGGLGIPVAQYLNSMGIGTLGLVEQDIVELHNLQRQVLYTEKDLGKSKLNIALERLKSQNSSTDFETFPNFLNRENALRIIDRFDVIVDATDNFPTRYLINDACTILKKPFVYGALHGFEGQVSVFNFNGGPTYRCLFPNQPESHEIPNCDENGVLGVVPSIIGSLQALEVVKMITGIGQVLSGKLLIYEGLSQQIRTMNFETVEENKKLTMLADSYGALSCFPVNTITGKEFCDNSESKQLIDVRSEDEFLENHLESALNIPLSELKNSIQKIDFNKPIYLICQSGKRSGIAWQELKANYPNASIFSIQGGMNQIALECH